MSIQKSIPMRRVIGNQVLTTSEVCMVSDESYTTEGESVVITKELGEIEIILNHNNTDHVIVKSLTTTKIKPIEGLIDEEYSEINIEKGACVELYYAFGGWFIVSSDGLKQS
jgi:hypothetical protein